jgi:hypothetical protein
VSEQVDSDVPESAVAAAPAHVEETAPDTASLEPIVVKVAGVTSSALAPAPIPAAPPEPKPALIQPSEANLEDSGLELVETHSASPELVAEAETAPQETSSRRRRSRRPKTEDTAPAESLVMVETQDKASSNQDEQRAEWGPPSNPRRRARPKAADAAPAESLVMVETKHTDEAVSS